MEQTVLAETNLIQILTMTRSKRVVNYKTDAPHHISMEDRLDPEQLRTIQDQLQAAIELSDPNNLHFIEKEVKIMMKTSFFKYLPITFFSLQRSFWHVLILNVEIIQELSILFLNYLLKRNK